MKSYIHDLAQYLKAVKYCCYLWDFHFLLGSVGAAAPIEAIYSYRRYKQNSIAENRTPSPPQPGTSLSTLSHPPTRPKILSPVRLSILQLPEKNCSISEPYHALRAVDGSPGPKLCFYLLSVAPPQPPVARAARYLGVLRRRRAAPLIQLSSYGRVSSAHAGGHDSPPPLALPDAVLRGDQATRAVPLPRDVTATVGPPSFSARMLAAPLKYVVFPPTLDAVPVSKDHAPPPVRLESAGPALVDARVRGRERTVLVEAVAADQPVLAGRRATPTRQPCQPFGRLPEARR